MGTAPGLPAGTPRGREPAAAPRAARGVLGALLLALLLHAACVGAAGAQELAVGVTGGFTRATLGGRDAGGFDPRAGLSAGAFASLRLTDALGVRLEALYTQRGGEAEAVEGTGSIRLAYLQVPVLARLTLPGARARVVRPHLFAGPAVGLRLTCELDAQVGATDTTLDCDAPLFGGVVATKRIEYALVVGGGTAIAVGPGEILLDARYDLGLSSIDDGPTRDDVRNRALAFLIGYSHPLRW